VTSRNFPKMVTFQVTFSTRFRPRGTFWQKIGAWKKNYLLVNFGDLEHLYKFVKNILSR
jgi:hypothetical protein